MLMDVYAVVGDDDGLVNWDILCLFMFPLFAAEKEDGSLALLFLFHSGVQMTLTLDGDGMLGSSLQEAESSGLTAGMFVVLYSQLLLLLGHGVQPHLHPVQPLLGHFVIVQPGNIALPSTLGPHQDDFSSSFGKASG